MKHIYLFAFVLCINVSFINAQQVDFRIRKISPSIVQAGDSVKITLKTPTYFNYTSNSSVSINFIPQSTSLPGININGGGFKSFGYNPPKSNFVCCWKQIKFEGFYYKSLSDTLNTYSFLVPVDAPRGLYNIELGVYTVPGYFTKYFQTITGGFFIEGGSASGRIYNDTDGNGMKNGSEIYLSNQNIVAKSLTNILEVSSDQNGFYNVGLNPGTYTVQPALGPNWQITSTAKNYILTISNSGVNNKDFGVSYSGSPGTIVSSFSAIRLRCNSLASGTIDYRNSGGYINNGTLKFYKDPLATIIGINPTNNSSSGDTLIWNVSNFASFESRKIEITLSIPGVNFLGQKLNFYTKGETSSTSNSYLFSSEIRCSYDPNDKTLYAAAKVNPDSLTFSTVKMEYQVNFENKGNDTAYVVVIRDTLDTNLDFNSLELVSSSHNVLVSKDLSTRALSFRFNNINLPSTSQNPIKSQGYIKFLVNRNVGIPEGTKIDGKASIYFDLNPSIVTNSVRTKFVTFITSYFQTSTQESSEFKLYPNPTSNEVYFSLENEVISNVFIFDGLGNKIYESSSRVGFNGQPISIENFEGSAYYYKVISEKGKTYSGLLFKK